MPEATILTVKDEVPPATVRQASVPLLRVIFGTAILLAVLIAALFFCWGRGPVIAAIPWFIPLIQGFMALAAFCVALIAFGRCRVLHDAVSYWIGIAFTSSFIFISFYILAWPGLSSNGLGLIAHLPGTAAWIITSMQAIFGVLLLVGLLAPWPRPQALAGRRWFWSVAGWAAGICVVNLLFVVFEERLPAFVGASGAFSPLLLACEVGLVLFFALGAVLATRCYRRTRDQLLGYLAVLLVAWAFSQLAVLIGGKRYDLWWYLARLLASGGYLALLFGMLAEYVRLYRNEREKSRALELGIAERERAEEALRESEDRYHSLFDSMTEGFLLASLMRDDAGKPVDFRIIEANLAYESVLGCRREDAIGRTLFELFPKLASDRFEAHTRVAQTGEPMRWQGLFAPTGRYYECFYYSPRPDQLAGIFMDITERKLAEEALKQSEAKSRLLIQYAPSMIYEIDFRGPRFISVNEVMCTILGYTHEELLAMNPLDLLEGDSKALFRDRMQHALAGEKVSDSIEYRGRAKDGRIIYGLLNISFRYQDGKPVGAIVVAHDITERKRMEEALQASLREKEVLLKEIHHRVKNNMQVISSLVSLQADTLNNPALRPLFNDLRDRVRTMALVHEKLYQSDSLARVNFAEYMQSLLNYLWRAHGEATANVRLTLDVQPVSISIEQAVPCGLLLNELVTNALKHAFRDRTDGELTVALHADADGKVCLSVRDNGVGLPADWRHSSSLGLQLVQMLTSQVRGTLDVRTDGGTAFALTFAQPSQS